MEPQLRYKDQSVYLTTLVGYIIHFRAAKGDNEIPRILKVDGKVFGTKTTKGKLEITQ